MEFCNLFTDPILLRPIFIIELIYNNNILLYGLWLCIIFSISNKYFGPILYRKKRKSEGHSGESNTENIVVLLIMFFVCKKRNNNYILIISASIRFGYMPILLDLYGNQDPIHNFVINLSHTRLFAAPFDT